MRNLVERTLNQDSSTLLLARSQALAEQLERLEHTIATHLPSLHQRLGRLEQLVCAVDANAIRRAPVEHMKLRHLWRNQRYALFELQRMAIQLLQQTMHTNGHKLAEIEALIDQCQEGAESQMVAFVPKIQAIMAQLDADAPPPLQPPPPPELPPNLRPPAAPGTGGEETATAADIPADGQEQPSLFAGHGTAPAAPNGADNGIGEAVR